MLSSDDDEVEIKRKRIVFVNPKTKEAIAEIDVPNFINLVPLLLIRPKSRPATCSSSGASSKCCTLMCYAEGTILSKGSK